MLPVTGHICAWSASTLWYSGHSLKAVLCVLQHACQRGDLHADLKAFRQTVFKKVYKEHKDPKERQKAAMSGRAGEIPASQVSVLPVSQKPRQHHSVLL